jgi:hypothetical protein
MAAESGFCGLIEGGVVRCEMSSLSLQSLFSVCHSCSVLSSSNRGLIEIMTNTECLFFSFLHSDYFLKYFLFKNKLI